MVVEQMGAAGCSSSNTVVRETDMADLVVLGFESKEQAQQVWALAQLMEKQELVDLADSALAWRDEASGRIKIEQAHRTAAAGAAGGALWGTLLGAVFLMPVFGLAVGAATGAMSGKLADVGIDDGTIRRIAETLEPGKAALFALVVRSTPDRVREALRPYNPTVVQTSLTKEREADLVAALQN
jgi:uncharacterized membrane protein